MFFKYIFLIITLIIFFIVVQIIPLLINVPRYTSSSLVFAMNATDHINVLFRKFADSLISRVIASPNSTVIALSIALSVSTDG